MIDSYSKAMEWVHSREKFGVKPGLERMEWILERLGHPERRLKAVHIAGTNGKGSTLSYLRNILQEEGYQIGTFTSPYIENFNERISMNGRPISDEDFIKVVEVIRPLVEEAENSEVGALTEFEVITVLAIYYFSRVEVPDIAIFEVGLGGRLDSTNVIHPMVSIITNIGRDHMNVLGNTIQDITKEKAGIIKSGVPVISAVEQEEAIHVVEETVKRNRTKLYLMNREFRVFEHNSEEEGERFSFESPFSQMNNVRIRMNGQHQVKNATLALMAVDFLKRYYSLIVDQNSVVKGLENTTWPGRFERIMENPLCFLDGAHNPEGIEALVNTIESKLRNKGYYVRILFSALSDKNIEDMVNQLNSVAFRITFTSFDFPRAESAKTLFEASMFTNKHVREEWQVSIEEEISQMKDNEALVVTGSLYFISIVREYLMNRN